jgi:alpha-tubulin suppressor-like RCC1 family protein
MNTDDGTPAGSRRPGGRTRLIVAAVLAGAVAAGGSAGAAFAAPAAVEHATGWAWGDNGHGQLCDGDTTRQASPVMMDGPDRVTQVSAGFSITVLLRSDGTVWACGNNSGGGLGDGTTTSSAVPVQVTGLTDVVQVAAGGNFGLALRADGTVAAWGNNIYGTLGDGTFTTRTTAATVPGVTGVVQIGAAIDHAIALRSDGTVMAWGNNVVGQLGNGDDNVILSSTPTAVVGLTGVRQIATHGLHSLALRSDGTVAAWGSNIYGQVGAASSARAQYIPVTVPGLTGVTQIAAGLHHSLALLSDGTVAGWGLNGVGALGDGTTTNRSTPVIVEGLTDARQISAGSLDSLALREDGTVAAWGGNQYGQIGDGTTTSRLTPVAVPGLSDVTQVSGGMFQTAAITGGRGPALVSIVRPAILGKARVDRTLTAVHGAFQPLPTVYWYQWLRDGSPIAGADAARYTVTAADSGHSLSVWIVAVRTGYADGLATSGVVQVDPRP